MSELTTKTAPKYSDRLAAGQHLLRQQHHFLKH